jgi:hypothetical protein
MWLGAALSFSCVAGLFLTANPAWLLAAPPWVVLCMIGAVGRGA